MTMSEMFPRISIDETMSLTQSESDCLLYICNILFPILPLAITIENPHPVTLELIRSVKRSYMLELIQNAQPYIKESAVDIYNGLRCKFGLSLISIVKTEEVKTEDVKTEDVKTEDVKTEDVKTEEVKTEEVK